tara:strand:+ start:1727 stop:2320 length:594 start_codon:yes stop_codon:yes gene_type:complete
MPILYTDSSDYTSATFLGLDAQLQQAAETGWYAKDGDQRRWVRTSSSAGSFSTDLSGCVVAPTVRFNQNDIDNIVYEGVTLGANVTSDGGQNVKRRGFLLLENTYSGVPNLTTPPNVNQILTINGSGTGVYIENRNALKAGTTYKVLAYAYGQEYSDSLNDLAVGYSDTVLTFTTQAAVQKSLGFGNTDGSACAATP